MCLTGGAKDVQRLAAAASYMELSCSSMHVKTLFDKKKHRGSDSYEVDSNGADDDDDDEN